MGEEIVLPALGRRLFCHFFALLLGASAGNAVAQDVQPTAEQLLAATISIGDFRGVKVSGDWSDAGPELCFSKNPEPGLLNCVGSNFVGWPAKEKISASSAVTLFADAATAAGAFSARLEGDKESYGDMVTGPVLGKESRYHARPAKDKDVAVTMARFHHGRYLVLVKAASANRPVTKNALTRLAKRVIARLDRIDAGTLQPPTLPSLARVLPDAGNSRITLVTASGPSDWLSFTRVDGEPIPSRSLRRLLHRGVGDRQGVIRIYSLKDIANHTVLVTVMPFRNENAARDYLKVSNPTEPMGTKMIVRRPGIDGTGTWEMGLTLHVGNHVVEVNCTNQNTDEEAVSPGCEPIVRELGEQAKAKLDSWVEHRLRSRK